MGKSGKTFSSKQSDTYRQMIMSIEPNKAIVRRYFEEVLDQHNLDILDEMVTMDCVIHRPEVSEPILGLKAFRHALKNILEVYSEVHNNDQRSNN